MPVSTVFVAAALLVELVADLLWPSVLWGGGGGSLKEHERPAALNL